MLSGCFSFPALFIGLIGYPVLRGSAAGFAFGYHGTAVGWDTFILSMAMRVHDDDNDSFPSYRCFPTHDSLLHILVSIL